MSLILFSLASIAATRCVWYLGFASCFRLGSWNSSMIIMPRLLTGKNKLDLAPNIISGVLEVTIFSQILNFIASVCDE